MLQNSAFRRSLYLTLATACAALGYAEAAVFPEVGALAVVAAVALAVIYRLETRVPLLSIPAANTLGAVLALAALLWAGFRVIGELRGGGSHSAAGWQVILVALFGPVLMTAVPAKLLRREKHAGDYWQLHAAGLASAGLAGAMAEDAVCFGLLAAYVGLAVWNLGLFFLARAGGAVPPIPRSADSPPAEPPVAGVVGTAATGRRAAVLVAGWVAAAAAVALPPFYLTPRSGAGRMEFGGPRREIGFTPDQMIDLNRTGPLVASSEVAFEVDAETDDGRAKDDLSPDQRWRASARAEYTAGVWQRAQFDLPRVVRTASPVARPGTPPDLGPGRYRLSFHVPAGLRGGILADPVVWAAGEPSPITTHGPDGPAPWYPAADGTFLRPRTGGRPAEYVQYTRALAGPGLGPPLGLDPATESAVEDPRNALVANPVPRVKEYADGLLDGLVRAGRLPADFRDPIRLVPRPEFREAIGRAFARHLSSDAGLVYSTQARRTNPAADPVEDFLFYTRAGHCQQFASALVLMLRAEGIPAVLVHGFRGCEGQGGGRYVVRHEHAHVWAEALIVRPGPGGRVWHWLSLDPAPAGPAGGDDAGGWWADVLSRGRTAFTQYFLQYDPERRDRLLREVAAAVQAPAVLGGVGAIAALGLAGWAARRARRAAHPAPGPQPARWLDRLFAALAPHGFTPEPGETPREFAAGVEAALVRQPATAAVAGVPAEWAEAYYQARFGGADLPATRQQELDARLAELCRALGSPGERR